MAVKPEDVVLSVFDNKDFDNKEFEMRTIIANEEELNMTPYYAHINGNTLNIYTTEPNPNPLETTLYDLVTDDIIEYKLVEGECPSDNYAVFYLVNKNAEFDKFADFKVSDFNYVFPCLSKTEIDNAQTKIKEKKDAAAKAETERLEAARLEADKVKEDAARLATAKLQEDAAIIATAKLQEDAAKVQEDAAKVQEDAAKAQEDAAKAQEDAARLETAKAQEDADKAKAAQVLPPPPSSVVPLKPPKEEDADAKNINAAQVVPPKPPTEEEEETARITQLLSKYKADTHKRKGLPNSITSGGVSQQNACYINAMLQMFIDIDEFLKYILFMNQTIKESEHVNLVVEEDFKNEFDNVVSTAEEVDEANIKELLILVYNFVTGENTINLSNFSNLNKTQLTKILFLLNFTTDKNDDVITKIDIEDINGNKTEKQMSEDQVDIYKKYYNIVPIENERKVVSVLDLTNVISSLESLINIKTKNEVFEKKHEIIQHLKQVFEYVIDENSTDKPKTIQAVQEIQTKIGVKVGAQEDAAAIYGLLNVVFDDELHQKYGVYVNGELISPYNLQQNHGKEKMSDIVKNIGIKKDQTNIIIGYQSTSQITVDTINVNNNRFNVAGIVQHLGGSTTSGATGGHYIYYSFKTGKIFNDEAVSQLNENDKNIKHTNFVALYEPYVDPNASTSARAGGSRKTFRVSRRKQVRPL